VFCKSEAALGVAAATYRARIGLFFPGAIRKNGIKYWQKRGGGGRGRRG
jgi:hypothetical protein